MSRFSGILQPDPVQFTATLGTESVTVVFDRARMTGRWERDIAQAMAEENMGVVTDKILGVFVSWDVVDDEGKPVPMTPELLLDLPSRALVALFQGMQMAASPSSEEGNASSASTVAPLSATSEPESQSSPNGSAGSTSPTPSASPSLT